MAPLDLPRILLLLCMCTESRISVNGLRPTHFPRQSHRQHATSCRHPDVPGLRSFCIQKARIDDDKDQDREEAGMNSKSPCSDDLESMTMQEKFDAFLDRPFFDPAVFDEGDESFLGKFANLVKTDYELAETLYVGVLFVILIIATQEVLRIQLYGDAYSPFARGGGGAGGKLF